MEVDRIAVTTHDCDGGTNDILDQKAWLGVARRLPQGAATNPRLQVAVSACGRMLRKWQDELYTRIVDRYRIRISKLKHTPVRAGPFAVVNGVFSDA